MEAEAGVAGDAGVRLPRRAYPAEGGDVRSVRLRARARPKAAGDGDRGAAPSAPSPFALAPLPGREGLLDGGPVPSLQGRDHSVNIMSASSQKCIEARHSHEPTDVLQT
jgi:hypothetical protein